MSEVKFNFDIKPAEKQEYLKGLRWIMSPERAIGKSTLLAIAFIETAHNYPNYPVHIFDHFPGEMAKDHMIGIIHNLLSVRKITSHDAVYEYRINPRNKTLIYAKREQDPKYKEK